MSESDDRVREWENARQNDPRMEHDPMPDKPLWITENDLDGALVTLRRACPVDRDINQPENNIYRTGWFDSAEKFHYHLVNNVARWPY